MIDSILAEITVGKIAIAVIAYFAGFVTRTFVLTAKERSDVQQSQYENAREHAKRQSETFDELMAALTVYTTRKGKTKLSHFATISSAAERYFYEQQITASAILNDKIDPISRDNLLMKKLIDSAEKTIPLVYKALHEIAQENGIDYPLNFTRSDYEAIYSAVEKYGGSIRRDIKLPAANSPSTDD